MRIKLRILASALLIAIATRAWPQAPEEAHKPTAETANQELKILEFDVVSIKLHKADSNAVQMQFTADRSLLNNVSLFTLISNSYEIKSDEIVGGPSWIQTTRFDVEAKIADGDIETVKKLPPEQRDAMMRKVLSDRFALKVHTENRAASVYVLEVAKGGAKLKPSSSGPPDPDGTSNHVYTPRFWGGEISGSDLPMSAVAIMLASVLHQEVVDKTGLSGRYDIALKWNPEDTLSESSGGLQEPSSGEGPSLFTALREQLGLKLESAKAPTTFLVIDHAEMPTGN
jgi:uncharacterized protein (TIGR03435 family)